MIEFDNDKMQELKRDSINKMLYDINNIVRLGSELHEDRQYFICSFNVDYEILTEKINKQGFDFMASGLEITVSELLGGYIVCMSECLNTLIKMQCRLQADCELFDNDSLKGDNRNSKAKSKGNLTYSHKFNKVFSKGGEIEIHKQFDVFWSEYPCKGNRKTALSHFIKVMKLTGRAEREAFGDYAGKSCTDKVAMMIQAFNKQFANIAPINIPLASKWLTGYCWRK